LVSGSATGSFDDDPGYAVAESGYIDLDIFGYDGDKADGSVQTESEWSLTTSYGTEEPLWLHYDSSDGAHIYKRGSNVFVHEYDGEAHGTITITLKSTESAYVVHTESVSGVYSINARYSVRKGAVSTAYTVTFDSKGGSEVAPITGVNAGSIISAPSAPTLSGYWFDGWYKDADCTTIWDFATDTVTANITLYAKWALPGTITSIKISDFPLTLAPGKSFDVSLTYVTVGESDLSQPLALSADVVPSLVQVDIVSSDRARVTAYSQTASDNAIYREAVITFTTSQDIPGSTICKSAPRTLVIANLETPVEVSPDVRAAFSAANGLLRQSGEIILPGSFQQPSATLSSDWYLIDHLDDTADTVIDIDYLFHDELPECFVPTGRGAASIEIDLTRSQLVPPGMEGLLPLTFQVTIDKGDLEDIYDASLVGLILSDPEDNLTEIFKKILLHNEILEGEHSGWFTRLVDGVLEPQQAVKDGILKVTGGTALTLTLSYYALDDDGLEAFYKGGYLIVPDGERDGIIANQVWLNKWKFGYAPGTYPQMDNTIRSMRR
jgi:uncharacterized repeat protein (TIGR02543 family)